MKLNNHIKNYKILIFNIVEELSPSLKSILDENFDVIFKNNLEEAKKALQNIEFSVIITGYEDDLNLELLIYSLQKYPFCRRLIYSKNIEEHVSSDKINKARIHGIINNQTDQEILIEIEYQLNEFYEQKRNFDAYLKLESITNDIAIETSKKTDDLIDMLINLQDSDDANYFSNLLITVLDGMRSLVIIYTNHYLENKNFSHLNNINQYLSDMEVIANQYGQSYLRIYLFMIKAHMLLLNGDLKSAKDNYKEANLLLNWIQNTYIEPSLLNSIEEFPLNEDDQLILNQDINLLIEIKLKELFEIKMNDLIQVSETRFNPSSLPKSLISYFMIVRERVPVFYIKEYEKKYNLALVSGFVIALSDFLKEVMGEVGDIETINHSNGVILFHNFKGISYVLFTSINDLKYRVALRQYAFEVNDLIRKIGVNQIASGIVYKTLETKYHRIFGI